MEGAKALQLKTKDYKKYEISEIRCVLVQNFGGKT
jgi:hypothetical protein